jgi:hypothetical protein
MKCALVVALFALQGFLPAQAAVLQMTPVNRVLNLIKDLEKEVEKDGKMEQKSYDKFACWCESTLERKAKDIADAKVHIEQLQKLIDQLNGELGAHGAEIEQLKKEIAANLDAQREATEVRDKENAEFEAEKTESEQCIGALESAIKVLTGAGTKGGFLETMRDAELLSVAADMRRVVLRKDVVSRAASKDDLDALTRFIEHPEEYARHKAAGGLSATQVGNNPFGDYAPQSTQIQGILKGMYDAFTGDLEKDNAEEADKQKAFEAFMATKKRELATLEETLKTQELDKATKTKLLADSEKDQDETKAQLEADEVFFEDTKQTCRTKAKMWAERSRLRTEELTGIAKAIQIIDSPESRAIFANSSTTFLQLGESTIHGPEGGRRANAYSKLKDLASKYKSLGLAQIAAAVKTGGHFDEVIKMIDKMIALLRKEEAYDINHRDRCQNGEDANQNSMEDLQHTMKKLEEEIERLEDECKVMIEEIKGLELAIEDTKADLADRLEMRNKEYAAHVQSLKDDDAAIGIVNQAIQSLSAFYEKNKIELSMAQRKQEPESPEYTVDQDKAPETNFEDGKYEGRKGDTGGIVSILSMVVEDMKNEMATARKDDAIAQEEYEKDKASMNAMLKAQEDRKVATEMALAEAKAKIEDKKMLHGRADEELEVQESLEKTLVHDCSWIAEHFESRREKRKTEMDGLVEAKAILAGANAGDYNELALSGR